MMQENVIRPLSSSEIMFKTLNDMGAGLLCYELELHSEKELDIDILRNTCEIVHRTIPTLNLCIREHQRKLVYCPQTSFSIDFEVCEASNEVEVQLSVLRTPYNIHDGPLWRTRILVPAKNRLEEDFPYTYKVFIGFHHAMTDGTSNARTVKHFLSVLDKLIDKKPVSEYPVGKICDMKYIIAKLEDAKKKLRDEETLRKEISTDIQARLSRVSPIEKMEPITTSKAQGIVINKVLDNKQTENLAQKLKAGKVSINSGIVAMLENAIVHLARKKGTETNLTELASAHALSMRRFDQENRDTFGLQMATMSLKTDVKNFQSLNILEQGRHIGMKVQEYLDNKRFLLHEAIRNLERQNLQKESKHLKKMLEHAHFDYYLSNLGDISFHFSGNGKHVQIESLFRTSNMDFTGICFGLFAHSFKGKLHFSFIMNPTFMSKTVGEELVKEFMDQISNFSCQWE